MLLLITLILFPILIEFFSVFDTLNDQKCLEIKKRNLGPESIQVATTLNNIGFVYRKIGDY